MGAKIYNIRGNNYKIVNKSNCTNSWGSCESPSSRKKIKSIYISEKINKEDKQYLLILIHELIHANCWDLDEEAVDEMSKSITEVLWDIGFRIEKPQD